RLVLSFDYLEPADAAADVDACPLGVLGIHREVPAFHRELRRRDGQLDKPAHLFDFFLLDVIRRIETLHLSRDTAGERGSIKRCDGSNAGAALEQRLPSGFGATT